MSGIIGGAGSRSGVIGITELDYEEGTWTPIPIRQVGGAVAFSGASTINSATYMKIGRYVTVNCEYTFGTISSQGSAVSGMTGLPYAPAIVYESVGCVFQNNALATVNAVACYTHSAASLQVLFKNSGNGAGNLSADWVNGGVIGFSITYGTND